jgi:hypothetical protein
MLSFWGRPHNGVRSAIIWEITGLRASAVNLLRAT